MGGELVGWKNTLVLIPYSERFRTFRKLFHQVIGTNSAIAKFHPIEEEETRKFLQYLLKKPEEFPTHIRRYLPILYFSMRPSSINLGLLELSSYASRMDTRFKKRTTRL